MKISILTSSDFPYSGAPENFIRNLYIGFQNQSHEINIYKYWGCRYESNPKFQFVHNYLFPRPPTRQIFLQLLQYIAKILYLPIYITRLRFIFKSECLLIYGLDSAFFLLPCLFFCKLCNLPVFRFITEIYPIHSYITHFIKWPDVIARSLQLSLFDKNFNGLIVLSTTLKQKLLDYHVDPSRILLIHNLVNVSHSYGESKVIPFLVGFFGYISNDNGINILIRQFNELNKNYPSSRLLLAGKLSSEFLWLSSLHSSTTISYVGNLSKDEVKRYMCNCDILINPRPQGIGSETGFPTKLGEYALSKRPFLSTVIPDLQVHFPYNKYTFWLSAPSEISTMISKYFTDPTPLIKDCSQVHEWARANLCCLRNARIIANFIESNRTI